MENSDVLNKDKTATQHITLKAKGIKYLIRIAIPPDIKDLNKI